MNAYEGWPDQPTDHTEQRDPVDAAALGDAAAVSADAGKLSSTLPYREADRIKLADVPAHRDAGGDDVSESVEAGDQAVVPHELIIGRLLMSDNADIPARAPDLLGPGQTTHNQAVRARLDIGLPGAEDYTTLSVIRLTGGEQETRGDSIVGRSFGELFLPGDGPTDEAFALTRSATNGTIHAAEIRKGGLPVGVGMEYGESRRKLDMRDPVTDQPTISRRNTVVSVAEDGGVRISDIGSRNGTTLTFREPAPEPDTDSRGRLGTYAHQIVDWWHDGSRRGFMGENGVEK